MLPETGGSTVASPRGGRRLILVDGRSGAGKTRWATAQRATAHGVQGGVCVLSLDDVYPGWDGLDAGHRLVYQHGLVPWSEGRVGLVPTWDWLTMAPGQPLTVDPDCDLIVEGCGAISRLTMPLSTHSVWLEATAAVRKQRALARDGDTFSPHWVRWALQEDRFYHIHRSPELAREVISGGQSDSLV